MNAEITYMKQDYTVQFAGSPFIPPKTTVFEMKSVSGLITGEPRIQSTYSKAIGIRPKGSNNSTESAWSHFNQDLMDKIRAIRSNDPTNLMPVSR
jgi:hypothetical protein